MLPFTVKFLAGNRLKKSVNHLMPSLEVSQIMMYGHTMHSHAMIKERLAWYWASNYIPWKWLYLPWLSGIWIWFNWGIRDCLAVYWEEVCRNWAEKPAACNLVFCFIPLKFTALADLASSRYCIPMDSPRPILPAELEFFNKGTGRGKS